MKYFYRHSRNAFYKNAREFFNAIQLKDVSYTEWILILKDYHLYNIKSALQKHTKPQYNFIKHMTPQIYQSKACYGVVNSIVSITYAHAYTTLSSYTFTARRNKSHYSHKQS